MTPFIRRHALVIASFIWGVAEATLFFFVPDVLLSYIGVKHGPRDAARASVVAAIGAAVGGVLMFLWSQADPARAFAAVSAVPAISAEMMRQAHDAMRGDWFGATMLGPLSSTPFKVFAITAPQTGVTLWAFAAASIAARLPRFLIVSVGAALIGQGLSRWLSERRLLWVLAGAWLLFYAVFFALMPN
jgi:membrane protein YqaA with SNARE-associated domain